MLPACPPDPSDPQARGRFPEAFEAVAAASELHARAMGELAALPEGARAALLSAPRPGAEDPLMQKVKTACAVATMTAASAAAAGGSSGTASGGSGWSPLSSWGRRDNSIVSDGGGSGWFGWSLEDAAASGGGSSGLGSNAPAAGAPQQGGARRRGGGCTPWRLRAPHRVAVTVAAAGSGGAAAAVVAETAAEEGRAGAAAALFTLFSLHPAGARLLRVSGPCCFRACGHKVPRSSPHHYGRLPPALCRMLRRRAGGP